MNVKIKTTLTIAALSVLTACGGGGDDEEVPTGGTVYERFSKNFDCYNGAEQFTGVENFSFSDKSMTVVSSGSSSPVSLPFVSEDADKLTYGGKVAGTESIGAVLLYPNGYDYKGKKYYLQFGISYAYTSVTNPASVRFCK